MTLKKARAELAALQRKLAAYGHAADLIFYDGATSAPKGTAANRGASLSVLSEEQYRLYTGKKTVKLLEFMDGCRDELSEAEKRTVHLLLKDIRSTAKIPMDEYVAYQELLVEADDVWHRAKESSDFPSFEPLLRRIFDANRRFAGYIAPDTDPYDYWLGEYEEGLTRKTCDVFFSLLRERLVPLLKKVGGCPPVSKACIKGFFPKEQQDKLSLWLMKTMGLDEDRVGLATTEHPFTVSLGSHRDVRITTHYYEEDVSSSMFSVIHEGGHALYDSNSAEELAYTALDGGVSMGIHESQSRFYENILGRSRAFCAFALPKLKELFPQMEDVSEGEFFRAVNAVEPSLIRTEADEVSYSLHVVIRYELEKRVMAGELDVAELPAEWNRLYGEYLGVEVPDDRRGVLQDSHWSGGSIGYFPSYALGSAYGAQFLSRMKKDIDVDACMSEGSFGPVNEWLRERIWRHGKLYPPSRLLADVLGEAFSPEHYLGYLEAKCREVYGI